MAVSPRITTRMTPAVAPQGPPAQARMPFGATTPDPIVLEIRNRCVGTAATTTTDMMNSELITRLRVPPNPEEIFDGDDSRRSGILAPSPTAMPDSPMQSIRQQSSCWAISRHGRPSIESLSSTSRQQGSRPPTNENRNFDQTIWSRCTGSRPRIQNRRPSRLIIG